MNIEYPSPKQKYKVLVRCFTFNQSRYIEDALNGFALQKTNFPFVCLVMDDASTDGEQEVIKAWMERECDMSRAETIEIPTSVVFIVPHKTNVSCSFAFYFLKYNLYRAYDEKINHVSPWRKKCKYEAICEGDDYWTDPLKLQKQVDFLDMHPEYSLSFTDIRIFNEDSGRFEENPMADYINEYLPNKKKDLFYDIILGFCRIQTMSVLFRLNNTKRIKENDRRFMMGDTPLWLDLSQLGKFHYLNEKTGCYRVHTGSASRDQNTYNKFRLSMYEMRIYYCNKYGYKIPQKIKIEYNKCAIGMMKGNGWDDTILPYPLYKMNFFQSLIAKKIRKQAYLRYWITFMYRVEGTMYSLYKHFLFWLRRHNRY